MFGDRASGDEYIPRQGSRERVEILERSANETSGYLTGKRAVPTEENKIFVNDYGFATCISKVAKPVAIDLMNCSDVVGTHV